MGFITTIETFRKAIIIGKFTSKLVFAAEDVVVQIGSNELNAAKQSLFDMRSSNNPQREFNMAITQLRSALEHFDSKRFSFGGFVEDWGAMEKCYQTALFISICYYSIGEAVLSEKFRNKSCDYFVEWINYYQRPIVGKLYHKEFCYDLVKKKVIEIGLLWPYSYPEMDGFFDEFSSKKHKMFDDAFEKHRNAVKEQYRTLTYRLTTE